MRWPVSSCPSLCAILWIFVLVSISGPGKSMTDQGPVEPLSADALAQHIHCLRGAQFGVSMLTRKVEDSQVPLIDDALHDHNSSSYSASAENVINSIASIYTEIGSQEVKGKLLRSRRHSHPLASALERSHSDPHADNQLSREARGHDFSATGDDLSVEKSTGHLNSVETGRSDGQTGISSVLNNIINILGGNVRVAASDTHLSEPIRPAARPPNRFQPPFSRPQTAKPSRINNRGPPQFHYSEGSQLVPTTASESNPNSFLSIRRPPVAPFVSAIPLPEQIVPLLSRKQSVRRTSSKPSVAIKSTSTTRVFSTNPTAPTGSLKTQSSSSESSRGTIKFPSSSKSSSSVVNPTANFESKLSSISSKPTARPYVPLPPRFVDSTARLTGIIPSLSSHHSTIPITPSSFLPSNTKTVTSTTLEDATKINWVEVDITTSQVEVTSFQPSTQRTSSESIVVATPPLTTRKPPRIKQSNRRPVLPPLNSGVPSPVAPTSVSLPPLGVGEIFDITVKASQGFGGGAAPRPNPTGQSYIIPVDINQLRKPNDIITRPDPSNNFVSIDGRRTYFNLEPKATANPSTLQTVGAAVGFNGGGPVRRPSRPGSRDRPSTTTRPRPGRRPDGRPAVNSGPRGSRPTYTGNSRRTSPPPVRIDTCIVGDDSTCKQEDHERCYTENSVSSCLCRPGFSRLRPRTPCKRVVSVVMAVRIDKSDGSKFRWDPHLNDPSSDLYHQVAWNSRDAINSAMAQTELSEIYMGSKVLSLQPLRGNQLLVNTSVQLLETDGSSKMDIGDALKRRLPQAAANAVPNNQRQSPLVVNSAPDAVLDVRDLDECAEDSDNDCHENARCENTFGSFRCVCQSGYDDKFPSDQFLFGRYCLGCTEDYCNNRGVCSVTDGQKVCRCRDQYYGSYCNIDGEVLGAALGATAVATIVIIATFIGLCKWSKRWQKSQQQSKLELGTLGASNTFSFVKPPATLSSHANLVRTMNERMRWAQLTDAMSQQSIYADPLTSLMNPVFDPSQLDSDHSLMTYSPIEFMSRTGAITPATSRCQSDAPAMLARTLSLPSQHGVTNDIWCRPHKPLTHAATLEQWRKPERIYGVMTPTPLSLYTSQPNIKSNLSEGPQSLGYSAMRPNFAAMAHRSMTPQPLMDRGGVHSTCAPIPLQGPPSTIVDLDDDREECMSRIGHPIPRPRSRASVTTQHMFGDFHEAEQREALRLRGMPMSAYPVRRNF